MLLENFSSGFLATAISSGTTAVSVNSGNTLPAISGTFTAIIWNNVTYSDPSQDPNAEIVLAQYSSLNNYTITRAQEGTAAVSHGAGALMGLYITAGVLNSLLIGTITNYGASASSGTAVIQNNIKIVYGSYVVSGTSQAITNLPFTSSSSYVVFLTSNASSPSGNIMTKINNSGSQFTFYTDGSGYTVDWMAIGT